LRADGEKRAKILQAEGDKRSRILQAEGVRQSKILEAEGSRLAAILEAQGQGQSLRVLALGAATLDQKSLAVLSLDAVKALGDGQATKIVVPFELTRLVDAVSQNLGFAKQEPPRPPTDVRTLESIVGPAETVLGRIPAPDEISKEIDQVEKEMEAENAETEAITSQKTKMPAKKPDGA
jgi:hypothetical protein